MSNLDYRLKEFLPASGHPALILDTSAGLSLGALPGLEDFPHAARAFSPRVDGLVCSPGQLRRLGSRTRADSALLVRADWSNTLRGADFPLPPQTAHYLPLLTAQDALELGASAVVVSFFLGYEEHIDGACQKNIVQLALTGHALGIPLLVEVCPEGPGILLPGKAVELGTSYALESGADVVIVPYPGEESLANIAAMLSVPWLLKPSAPQNFAAEWQKAASLGAAGVWLSHTGLDSLDSIRTTLGGKVG